MNIPPVILFLLILLVCQSAGAIGALTSSPGRSPWYEALQKPWFQPPNWLFGPVWIVLYTLMAISAFLVIKKGNFRNTEKWFLILFVVQLILNAIWTPLFFRFHELGWALVDISLLLIVIVGLILMGWKVHKTSAYLLIPYLLWVSFALTLNFSIWKLNS